MFERIVLALDGSHSSQLSLELAAKLARQHNAKVVIAHAEEHIVGKGGGTVEVTEPEIQAGIRRQAEELSAQGIETSVEMRSVTLSGPAHVIEDIADEVGADLIVVGTRGHSPIAGLLLGSVTQRLLHIAERPVLVAPAPKR